ncbi:MAG: hypothetical protein LBU26_04820 [Synergistaceae bacterium]|nr:hypothetical protein [Synergistaceae bacterium]
MMFFAPATRPSYAAELRITGSLPALPVLAGVTQRVEIALPPGAPDGDFDAGLEAKSGWGILLFETGPSVSGTSRISREAPLIMDYRWSGATPVNAPAEEVIAVDIPALGLSGEMKFHVGVDVRIKEISLPSEIRPGVFNPVEIFLEDAFDPSLDVAELLGDLGISAELAMTLSGGSESAPGVQNDPVARAFFGETGASGETSYPGKNFIPGSPVSEGGKFSWRGADGRVPGITPPSAGKYNIEATLKANLGGAPLKHWSSPEFEAAGEVSQAAGLPGLIASAITIMARLDADAAGDAENAARGFLASGNESGAVSSLGEPLRRAFGANVIPSLGKFSSALAASGKSEQELVAFLGSLMKGMGDCGVLLFTRGGVAEWSVKDGAAYENARYVSVPFSSRQNIVVKITGSDSEDVSMWKVIAPGTNAKKYPKGAWIKEITVYTSELTPQK